MSLTPFPASVPPSWVDRPPENVDQVAGNRVNLPCQAKGSPQPSVVWKKEIGEFKQAGRAISERHTHL